MTSDDQVDQRTDEELIRSCQEGDAAAFGVLHDRYGRRILNICYRILQHREDAEDAAALVFLTAWRRLHRVRVVDGSVGPWLVATAVNVSHSNRRNRGRYRTFLTSLHLADDETNRETDAADRRIERRASLGPTWTAFSKLTKNEQMVLILCVLEELPQEEAGAILGVPVGTVKSRLSRAKERLRKQIEIDSALAPDSRGGEA